MPHSSSLFIIVTLLLEAVSRRIIACWAVLFSPFTLLFAPFGKMVGSPKPRIVRRLAPSIPKAGSRGERKTRRPSARSMWRGSWRVLTTTRRGVSVQIVRGTVKRRQKQLAASGCSHKKNEDKHTATQGKSSDNRPCWNTAFHFSGGIVMMRARKASGTVESAARPVPRVTKGTGILGEAPPSSSGVPTESGSSHPRS